MKKVSLIALVAIMLVGFSSCKYKNPALEDSTNPMVKEFEYCNLLLGKTKAEAEKALKDNGYVAFGAEEEYYAFTKKVNNVDYEVEFMLGSKGKVYAIVVDFEPEAAGTFLADFDKMKEVVTTMGSDVKISTKENCEFKVFVNSSFDVALIDYNTMLGRIDSSDGGFSCMWFADADGLTIEQLAEQELTALEVGCELDDYYSYNMYIAVMSVKYK